MTDYVRPILKQKCPNCNKDITIYSEDINEFAEATCPNCGKPFWSTNIIDFLKDIGRR